MSYLISFLATAGIILFLTKSGYVGGIGLQNGYISALVFAIILSIVNLILGTFLRIITFPIQLITLGAFSFVISVIVVYVADKLYDGITLTGILPIVAISLAVTLTRILMKIIK